jgi:hypothetical protein
MRVLVAFAAEILRRNLMARGVAIYWAEGDPGAAMVSVHCMLV